MKISQVLAVLLLSSFTVHAQPEPTASIPFKEEKVGGVDISTPVGSITAEGVVAGTRVRVDDEFTTKYENKPPSAPFEVIVPKIKEIRFLPGGKKTGVPELLRITLPDAKGEKPSEILRFGSLNLPQGPSEQRLADAAKMLQTVAFPMFTKGFSDPKIVDIYFTKVGSYDAAVTHITMTNPESGAAYLVKTTAILHPSKEGGVVGFLMADKELSEVKSVEDLSSKGLGVKVIHSVKFVEE